MNNTNMSDIPLACTECPACGSMTANSNEATINIVIANMQNTVDEKDALIEHLKAALKSYVDNAKEIDLGGADCIVSTCESLEMAVTALGMDLTSPVSEKAK